jgi:prenyltransferase beta subunit
MLLFHGQVVTLPGLLSRTCLCSCQTYEGGFGGEPGSEAHGGYVFCAFAALIILGRAADADIGTLEVGMESIYD